MNTEIFNGTLLAEVQNFTGDYIDAKLTTNKLFGETVITEMIDPEKVLMTLSARRLDEVYKIVETICGVNPHNMIRNNTAEVTKYDRILVEKTTPEQAKQMFRLQYESKGFEKMMWTLLNDRIYKIKPGYASLKKVIRPGFKVAVESDIAAMMFNDMFGDLSKIMGMSGMAGFDVHVLNFGK